LKIEYRLAATAVGSQCFLQYGWQKWQNHRADTADQTRIITAAWPAAL